MYVTVTLFLHQACSQCGTDWHLPLRWVGVFSQTSGQILQKHYILRQDGVQDFLEVKMFTSKSIDVPVVGLVENMAWFTPEELPENKYYIFGKDGGKNIASELKIPFLGEIPIVQGIREGGDKGEPIAHNDGSPTSDAFQSVASKLIHQVELRNKFRPETTKVKTERK